MEKEVEIKVLFFAKAREVIGQSTDTITVTSEVQTLQELTETIVNIYPQLQCLQKSFIVAHNQTYLCGQNQTIELKENDEIAIIPPISGG